MAENLQKKTFSGVIWGFMEKFSVQFFAFVQQVILARLLSPSDFGLIAMAGVFNAICYTLVDSGFASALIRKKNRPDLDFSTVFVVNVCMSLLVGAILCACSGFIADFYHQPILVKIVCINGVLIVLGSFTAVQGVRLSATMQFKLHSKINIINSFGGGIVSIVFAILGFGVWSLVYPGFFTFALGGYLYWHYQHWFPGIQFSKKSFRDMFSYGSKMLASGLLNTLYNNMYPLIIGKKYTSSDLGYFSKGQTFTTLPSITMTNVLAGVSFPVLSQIQDDDERLAHSYRRLLRLSAFVLFPVLIGMAALAKPLIIVLITAKWLPSVIYLQILAFALMWYPIHAINLSLLQVKGRSDLFLRLEIIKKILGVSILIFTMQISILGMCLGIVVSSLISLYINTYYTSKLIHVTFSEQMKDLTPSLVYSVSMGGVVYFVIGLFSNAWMQLTVGIILGACYYYLIPKITKSQDLTYLKEIIDKNILSKTRKIETMD